MSHSLLVHTETLCPRSLTGKQWAGCEAAHSVPSQLVALIPGQFVWLLLPLLAGSAPTERLQKAEPEVIKEENQVKGRDDVIVEQSYSFVYLPQHLAH